MRAATTVALLLVGSGSLSMAAADRVSTHLPDGVPPVIGCWFWHDREFAPDGYRPYVDLVSRHATYDLLTASLRAPNREVTDPAVHDQIGRAVAYARERGIGVAMDLDVRLAREAFRKAYPEEMQEMLRLREVELGDSGEAALAIASETPSDHYTSQTTPYIPLSGRLVRIYTYVIGPEGIEPGTLRELPAGEYRVAGATPKEVSVAIPCGEGTRGRRACVMAAFSHLTPDVFAPHLLQFQRDVLRQYADMPLAGACKDEWGFPPCFDGCPRKDDFWFSRPMAEAYAHRTGGRDLVADCLLMHRGERGREQERRGAISHFMELCRVRCGEIEGDFYDAVKDVWGAKAVVATHPTWWPNPDTREFKKNGLSWWVARRDFAQTDEVTPFSARTALAKKWGSPLWVNMYYSGNPADYERGIWTHALGGGRINFHPVYPARTPGGGGQGPLLRGRLTRGDARIRLLNFITRSPLDCPVAVVFGQACAMNWAGPAYDDVGLAVADGFWRAGFPADLIPANEIASGALRVDRQGRVCYGAQRYAGVVLYHPEFEGPATAAFFRRAARGGALLARIGNWSSDFEGRPFDGGGALPETVSAYTDGDACVREMVAGLAKRGVSAQTGATDTIGWDRKSASPPPAGECRLVDGTRILVAGEHDVAGDPIRATLTIDGHPVEVEATGVAAVRLRKDGTLEALAAGGLRRFRGAGLTLELGEPVDMALWRDSRGRLQGVLQGWESPVPAALAALTSRWLRLAVPPPLPEEGE